MQSRKEGRISHLQTTGRNLMITVPGYHGELSIRRVALLATRNPGDFWNVFKRIS